MEDVLMGAKTALECGDYGTISLVPTEKLFTMAECQRPLSLQKVKKIASIFDARVVQIPIVIQIGTGDDARYHVCDSNHTRTAAERVKGPHQIPVRIVAQFPRENATARRAAVAIFHNTNALRTRIPAATMFWNTFAVDSNSVPRKIMKMCHAHGMTCARDSKKGLPSAVPRSGLGRLESAYRILGPKRFDWMLHMLSKAYRPTTKDGPGDVEAKALEATFLQGATFFWVSDFADDNEPEVVEALRVAFQDGWNAKQIIAEAGARRTGSSGENVTKLIPMILMELVQAQRDKAPLATKARCAD